MSWIKGHMISLNSQKSGGLLRKKNRIQGRTAHVESDGVIRITPQGSGEQIKRALD
jgi:hypothetical protein